MRTPYFSLFLICSLLFTSKLAAMDGLQLNIPEQWQIIDKQASMWTYIPNPHKDSRFMLFSGIPAKGNSDEKLAYITPIANKGWTVEKIINKGRSKTKSGNTYDWEEAIVNDGKGSKVARLINYIYNQDKIHIVVIYCGSENAWNALFPEVKSLVSASSFGPGKVATEDYKFVGTASPKNFLHCSFSSLPMKYKSIDTYSEQNYNQTLKDYAFEVTIKHKILAENHPKPVSYLTGLLKNADWGIPDYSKSHQFKIAVFHEFINKNGNKVYYCLVQESDNGIVFSKRAGVLIEGKGWSICFASAIGGTKPYLRLAKNDRMTIAKEFDRVVIPNLLAMASSVKWGQEWSRNTALESKLIQKKTYRYAYESTSSFGDHVSSSSRYVSWDFISGNQFATKYDGFFGGVHGDGGGYASRKKSGSGSFKILSAGNTSLLVVTYTDNSKGIHLLEFNKSGSYGSSNNFSGLAIDHQIEGKYYSSNAGSFRED